MVGAFFTLSLLYNVFFCASYFRNDSRSKRPRSTSQDNPHAKKKTVGDSGQSSLQWRRCVDSLTGWFGQEQLEEPARQCRFLRRKPRKITPLLFLQATVLLVSQQAVSLSRWATLLGVLGCTRLAKQSLWERLTPQAVAFLEHVLGVIIARRVQGLGPSVPETLKSFGRVFIQDSTTIKLTAKLAAAFPGSTNHCGTKNGQLKIQAVYELVSQQFVHFGLSGFTRNDQAAAHDILPLLQPGDLVLRDLGYFVVESFEQIACKGAFFLSRLRSDTTLRSPRTQKDFKLLGRLKRQGHLDAQVLLGTRKMPVRLVAVKLPAPVAAERRRKARNNRDKRCCPGTRSLQLLGWAIFITNVPPKDCSARTIAKLYGLRWQIESLFKMWKSHFGLTEVPKGSSCQLLVVIYARLMFLAVISQVLRVNWHDRWADKAPAASRFKIAALLAGHFLPLCLEAWGISLTGVLIQQFEYHGRYDRRSRLNSVEKLMKLS